MRNYKTLFLLFRNFIFNLIQIIIFPIQLLLWILNYALSFQHKKNEENKMINEAKEANNIQEDIPETKTEVLKTISVKTGKRLHIIPISEIVCIQAYGDYVNIMTMQGVYLKEQTLKYFNEHLPEQFLKVHRSYIVNINAIETIERYGRDQYLLLLKNKEKIKATLEGYKMLKGKLNL